MVTIIFDRDFANFIWEVGSKKNLFWGKWGVVIKSADDLDPMTNPSRDARPEDQPLGLDYTDPRSAHVNHQVHQGNPASHIGGSRVRRTRGSSRRRMHLASQVTSQGSAGGNHISDYVLTADLLAERTLDGLLAEHPGELVRTGEQISLAVLLFIS